MNFFIQLLKAGGLLVGILIRGVSPGSPNPDHILDQKVAFFTPVLKKLSYHYLDYNAM